MLSSSWIRVIAMGATIVAVVAVAIGVVLVQPELAPLQRLGQLPIADQPTAGPARYRGRLRGPATRMTPAGRPAAAYWWSVDNNDDESSTTYCSGRDRDRLVLETAAGSLAIAWSSAHPDDVGLVSDERDKEFGRRIMIDVGARGGIVEDDAPAGTCTGSSATYRELAIEQGAVVEVVGCARDGVIAACDGELGGLLADDLATYLGHARTDAMRPLLRAIVIAASVLVVAAFAILGTVTRALRMLRPERVTR